MRRRCTGAIHPVRGGAVDHLTQDDLDFHGDMEDYFESKRPLSEMGPGVFYANVDYPYGRRLAEQFVGVTFSAAGARPTSNSP